MHAYKTTGLESVSQLSVQLSHYGGREGHDRITDQRNTVSDSTVSDLTVSDSTVSDSTGQVETEETENGNGKLKRKTEAEIGNGKAEIGKWSSTFVALMASFAHARSVWS